MGWTLALLVASGCAAANTGSSGKDGVSTGDAVVADAGVGDGGDSGGAGLDVTDGGAGPDASHGDAAGDAAEDGAEDVAVWQEPPFPDPLSGIDAANAVPAGDPLALGQYIFLYRSGFGTEVTASWPPVDFMLQLQKDEPEVFGNQFEKFGFVPDPNDDLPVGLKRGVKDPTRI